MPIPVIKVYSADKTVQTLDGEHPLAVTLAPGGSEVSATSPLPVDVRVVDETNWTAAIDAIRLDDDPTSYNGAAINVEGYTMLAVDVFIDSTSAPTNVRLIAQFSVDGGTTWADYVEGLWASLYWEDTATASGLRNCFHLPIAGWDRVRFRIVGTGTDGGNYFDVTVRVRAFRGAFAGAHA